MNLLIQFGLALLGEMGAGGTGNNCYLGEVIIWW